MAVILATIGCTPARTELVVHVDAPGLTVKALTSAATIKRFDKPDLKPLPSTVIAPTLPGDLILLLPDEQEDVTVTLVADTTDGKSFAAAGSTKCAPHTRTELSLHVGASGNSDPVCVTPPDLTGNLIPPDSARFEKGKGSWYVANAVVTSSMDSCFGTASLALCDPGVNTGMSFGVKAKPDTPYTATAWVKMGVDPAYAATLTLDSFGSMESFVRSFPAKSIAGWQVLTVGGTTPPSGPMNQLNVGIAFGVGGRPATAADCLEVDQVLLTSP